MDTKDIIYIIGIISAFLIGIYNLNISIKNRRNNIREHLYKEQVAFGFTIFLKFTELNKEVDKVFNFLDKNENEFNEKIDEVEQILFAHEFIIPNELISPVKYALKQGVELYIDLLTKGTENCQDKYKEYYNAYLHLLEIARSYFGTDKLSDENRNLYRQKKIESQLSVMLKKVKPS